MKKTLVLFALGAIAVAMVVPPQFTARTLTAIHLNSSPTWDKRIANQYIMVLKYNAVGIRHGGMKVAHRRKSYRQNGSLFGSDRRLFAILTPPTTTERPSMPGFSRSCRFVLLWKGSIAWLVLRISYAFQLMSARSNHATV